MQISINNYENQIDKIIDFLDSETQIDSLTFLPLLKEINKFALNKKNNNTLFKTYFAFSDVYKKNQNYVSTKKYSELAQTYDNKSINPELRHKNYFNLAAAVYESKDLEKTLSIYNQAYENAKDRLDNDKIASIYNYQGLVLYELNKLDEAVEVTKKALNIREQSDNLMSIMTTITNLGIYFIQLSDYNIALDYLLKALKYAEELNDEAWISKVNMNIGTIYHYLRDWENALSFYHRSLSNNDRLDDELMLAKTYNNVALVYKNLKQYSEALIYYEKSMNINKTQNNLRSLATTYVNMASMLTQIDDFEKAEKYLMLAKQIFEDLNHTHGLCSVLNNIGNIHMKRGDYEKAIKYSLEANELALSLNMKQFIITSYALLIKIYELNEDYELAYKNFLKYFAYRDSVYNQDRTRHINELQIKYETEKKEKENELLRKDSEIQLLELEQAKTSKFLLIISLVFVSSLALSVVVLFSIQKRNNQKLSLANELIATEKEKSEKLLLNILPSEIANELKNTGKSIPQSFDNVTIFLSDLINFTEVSTKLSPVQVIDELNELFCTFDNIMENHSCARIKTIGDAYMAVCGMPESNSDHATNIMNAALDIIKYIDKRNETNIIKWQIRIGVNSGKVVGGFVGIKKFIYDIFGDTINTAARLEQLSNPMQINISDSTYELIKDRFNFSSANSVLVKGKGMMNLYHYSVTPKNNLS